ncbi:reverse transcriptase domain-containing protein [Rhizobium sp. ZK1]|uniref:reverse transcriptase domain-containing protein n=1 Tax=Rhizobium sp. ZK1 TaxID=3389872 RepID=UPI0039F6EC75
MQLEDIVTVKNTRAIWKKLQTSIVPIVGKDDLANIIATVESLVKSLGNNSYIPNIGHGYLGYLKNAGCTRFVPILTKEDMAVYYLLVLSLQDYIVRDLPGVYGAWRIVPKNAVKENSLEEALDNQNNEEEHELVDPYFSDSFAKKAWFKDWTSFTDLLRETCDDKSVGSYVLTSDIANFYDTIDINTLIDRVRSTVQDSSEIISLLSYFLRFWDRRIKGYSASSKGIPQEIISDASRMLANFYLRPFDESFINACNAEGVVYIRWADDIVIFGSSPAKLERLMHRASRLLLNIGLNLSAAKTRHYTRSSFKKYRALDLISAVNNKDYKRYLRELKSFDDRYGEDGGRIDTVLKASLNMLSNEPKSKTTFSLYFIEKHLAKYEFFCLLNEGQMLKKYKIFGDVKKNLRKDIDLLLMYPYAAPRATMLSFLSKYSKFLMAEGVSKVDIGKMITLISLKNGGSEIIEEICAPAAEAKI